MSLSHDLDSPYEAEVPGVSLVRRLRRIAQVEFWHGLDAGDGSVVRVVLGRRPAAHAQDQARLMAVARRVGEPHALGVSRVVDLAVGLRALVSAPFGGPSLESVLAVRGSLRCPEIVTVVVPLVQTLIDRRATGSTWQFGGVESVVFTPTGRPLFDDLFDPQLFAERAGGPAGGVVASDSKDPLRRVLQDQSDLADIGALIHALLGPDPAPRGELPAPAMVPARDAHREAQAREALFELAGHCSATAWAAEGSPESLAEVLDRLFAVTRPEPVDLDLPSLSTPWPPPVTALEAPSAGRSPAVPIVGGGAADTERAPRAAQGRSGGGSGSAPSDLIAYLRSVSGAEVTDAPRLGAWRPSLVRLSLGRLGQGDAGEPRVGRLILAGVAALVIAVVGGSTWALVGSAGPTHESARGPFSPPASGGSAALVTTPQAPLAAAHGISASPSGGDPSLLATVRGLAEARAQVLMGEAAMNLSTVDVPASPAWAADQALLARLSGAGVHLSGLSFTVSSARRLGAGSRTHSARWQQVEVVVSTSAHVELDDSGRLRARVPPVDERRVVLTLVAVPGGASWRVESVST